MGVTAIIGHRGVGKTSFLKTLRRAYELAGESAQTFDLDEEIQKSCGQTAAEIFVQKGEKHFRELEQNTFTKLYQQFSQISDVYIAVGAGFQSDFPSNVHVLWLRRRSDKRGRIFLNRPRLNPELSPLDEYFVRASQREPRYRALAHEHYFLPEGETVDLDALSVFLGFRPIQLNGSITVLPWMLTQNYFEKRISWGIRYFELRDDLLTRKQLELALQWIPLRQRLSSRRREARRDSSYGDNFGIFDWALELGSPPEEAKIISLHDRSQNLEDDFQKLATFAGRHVKFSPEIKNFKELWQCHRWWKQNPGERSFLPRSQNDDFIWYRALFGPQMEIGFFREDEGSSADQPTFCEWISGLTFEQNFAAIIGDPVNHSWTPTEQKDFFASYKMPVVRIRIPRASQFHEDLEILRQMGLAAAAVTSPFKKSFIKNSANNTLAWDFVEQRWQTANTDPLGLMAVLKKTDPSIRQWAVWGGGGIIDTIANVLPGATFFSARQGTPRQDGTVDLTQFDGLIWACGRGEFCFPPGELKPKVILDLNYSEESPGLEFAATTGAKYISGICFFKAQAAGQREFWQLFLQKRPWKIAHRTN